MSCLPHSVRKVEHSSCLLNRILTVDAKQTVQSLLNRMHIAGARLNACIARMYTCSLVPYVPAVQKRTSRPVLRACTRVL